MRKSHPDANGLRRSGQGLGEGDDHHGRRQVHPLLHKAQPCTRLQEVK